jgi:hypothetical protein
VKYICAQPANDYYTWQVEVVINNFTKWGVNPTDIQILCSTRSNFISDSWNKLVNGYKDVKFFFYEDSREDKGYIPGIYFDLMSNHLTAYPELKDEILFLHDSDIIFTRKPELDWVVKSDTWYMSNTNSYINYDYITSKGMDVYNGMCDIIGIDKLIPKLFNKHSGGAQYVVNGEGSEFWRKVEKDSAKLYRWFNEIEANYVKKHDGDYPIQKWTAGMWSFLWNGWLAGHPSCVDSRLDFGWCTGPISEVSKYWILHNAGVTESGKGLFYKGDYMNRLPYLDLLSIDETKASSYYWKEVQSVAEITVLTDKRSTVNEGAKIKQIGKVDTSTRTMKLIEVVVPTLWKSDNIHTMLNRYINNPYIKRIHLIDNGKSAGKHLKLEPKITVYEPATYNGYWVNPAWNLGIANCAEDSLACIINDDIIFDDSIFQYLSQNEKEVYLVGMLRENLTYFTPELKYNPKIVSTTDRNWGWGIFITTHKKYWKPIPDDLKVYYGDDWLIKYLGIQTQVLTGLPINGSMSASAQTEGVSDRYIKDGDAWYSTWHR